MKAQYALTLVPVLALAIWRLYPLTAKSAPRLSAASPESASAKHIEANPGGELDDMAASSAKIDRLQAELSFKDALLRKVMLQSALDAQRPAEERNARTVESISKALDQRLFDGPQNDAESQRLESGLGQITAKLPGDVMTQSVCSATMCRLVIHGSENAIGGATAQVGSGIPKGLFGSTMVVPTGEGESTMYLALDPGQLDLSPENALTNPAPDKETEPSRAALTK